MPGSRHSGRAPGPLDNLPRPLDERDGSRRRRRRRRIGAAAALVVLVGAGGAWLTTLGNRPLGGAGEVQGAVGTPLPTLDGPAAVAQRPPVATPSPTPKPSPTPTSTPTPSPTPLPVAALTDYRSPLPHGRLTLPFGPSHWGSRLVEGESFHDGIDLATFCGDHVVAAHAGKVLAAGRRFDDVMGWIGDLKPYYARLDAKHLWSTLPIVVVIDDGNGYRSVYAHFSKLTVKKGQEVRAGQMLGYEGMTGRASGCHVHYGLFSPLETKTFTIDPAVVKRMKVPKLQIARVDPLLVLPQHAPKAKAAASPKPS
jgi:murein DD-endopeptidase MepM/ murein hydrolase activator NlpD